MNRIPDILEGERVIGNMEFGGKTLWFYTPNGRYEGRLDL